MSQALFSEPRFTNDDAARKHLESLRWPDGPICPHCGAVDRISTLQGKGHRPGLRFCGHCREQFTVTVGTVFERSKIPLHKWLLANHLLCSSKKGMSSHQLSRMLGVTYKTAWFMSHRLREAMTEKPTGPLGSNGGPVEVDETYWGHVKAYKQARKGRSRNNLKMQVVSLVERGGNIRSFHVSSVNAKNVGQIMREHIAKKAHLMTDESRIYIKVGKEFQDHSTVNHSAKEYARGIAHVNTLESYFNIFKRGLVGTFHHVSEQHLQRYANEFDFRYNYRIAAGVTDIERADIALKGISGKRLTYRRTHEAA